MTLSVSTQVGPVGAKLVVDTDADEQAQNNVTGQADTIYMLDVDNALNAAQVVYLKVYNATSCVPGTDNPDMIIRLTGGERRVCVIPEGELFDVGISFCCVISPGSPGTTGPTSAVTMRMVTS